jgi:hypothetical protein
LAETNYNFALRAVPSFIKTMQLAGKSTTINLTYCGATKHSYHVDFFANVVRYFVGQGFTGLQLTLENEPNGPEKGDGFRARFNDGIKTGNQEEAQEAVQEYVDAYQRLNQDLSDPTAGNIRNNVKVIGGDMVGNRREEFFRLITKLGLNDYVDGYSFHVYWGANKSLKTTLEQLLTMKQLAGELAPGKQLQITEFGKEHFASAEEKKHNQGLGCEADEAGVENAFEQTLFALSAINDGFTGAVKWDAFYAYTPRKSHYDPIQNRMVGDRRGNYGHFSMIDARQQGDSNFRLMSMFTHAVEPGWQVHGSNYSPTGADAHFRCSDGLDGAVIAMRQSGGAISTAGLPNKPLRVMIWNANGNGTVTYTTAAHGDVVPVPALGAVAITTLG